MLYLATGFRPYAFYSAYTLFGNCSQLKCEIQIYGQEADCR